MATDSQLDFTYRTFDYWMTEGWFELIDDYMADVIAEDIHTMDPDYLLAVLNDITGKWSIPEINPHGLRLSS